MTITDGVKCTNFGGLAERTRWTSDGVCYKYVINCPECDQNIDFWKAPGIGEAPTAHDLDATMILECECPLGQCTCLRTDRSEEIL
jgi:hypothetical protein